MFSFFRKIKIKGWMMKTIKGVKEIGIKKETILNKTKLRGTVRKFECFQEGVKPKRARIYSEK